MYVLYLTGIQDKIDEGHDDATPHVGHTELPAKLVSHREGHRWSYELFDFCEWGLQPALDGGIEGGAVFIQRGPLDGRRGSGHLTGHQAVTNTHQGIWTTRET